MRRNESEGDATSRLVSAGELEIRCEMNARGPLVELSGELDLAGVAVLKAELDRAGDDGAEIIVVDLQRLTFIDSTGLSTLFYALERAKAERRKLVFTRSSTEVERTLHLSGLDRVLTLDSRARELDR
jgi:anti-sigma B factor antagonist